eukprot:CAMPEP_0194279638 /NCGR_PEP_ID=MMETSP0169-20130528/14044_1 /TAXON_ID=218684 /ORGANISM="Corethron pennatum, Strain L29A3" /LENGTH=92 /DNA_ID=CAMNT_0039024087 /DNA_START=114 /DNA_END=392 /DNA_ORIENTATION=-
MPMTLVSTIRPTDTTPAKAVFRVLPRMTKHEVKEYLTKIYKLPVVKVNTVNYDGKRRVVYGRRKIARYKDADYKKAIVSFDSSVKDLPPNPF